MASSSIGVGGGGAWGVKYYSLRLLLGKMPRFLILIRHLFVFVKSFHSPRGDDFEDMHFVEGIDTGVIYFRLVLFIAKLTFIFF